MTRTYRWAYGTTRLTLAEMEGRWSWANVHPEVRRRAVALMNAGQDLGHDPGIGEGARNTTAQLAEFYRRHYQVASGGCCTYGGLRYALRAGMAPISPPGFSNHEDGVYEGDAIAIDFVGWEDHWFDANCERFGIKNFGGAIGPGVNGEEWHGQPMEFRNSRTDVNADIAAGKRLTVWPLPGGATTPTPLPTAQEGDMIKIDMNPNTQQWVSLVIGATTITHTFDGNHAAVLARAGITQEVVNRTEMLGILRSLRATNASPFAAGMASADAEVDAAWQASLLRRS